MVETRPRRAGLLQARQQGKTAAQLDSTNKQQQRQHWHTQNVEKQGRLAMKWEGGAGASCSALGAGKARTGKLPSK